jgi:vitamin B12 transporter
VKYIYYAAVAVTLLPSAVVAQDEIVIADLVIADSKRGDIIVTANRVEQPPESIGQAVTVINHDTLDTRQTAILTDILITTPGVTVSRTGGIGSVTSVRIRGAESAQTLVLIDGVRVNDPSDPSGAYDFGNLLPANSIDRVEVLRGPNSVVWGSQAIGGIVAVTTEKPSDGFAGQISGEYGSFDTTRGQAAIGYGTDTIKARFGGNFARTDGISAIASGTEKDGNRQYGANGRVDIAISDNFGIDLRGYYSKNKTEFDDGFFLADSNDVGRVKQLIGYAGINAALFEGRFRNRVGISRAKIDRSYAGGFAFEADGKSDRIEYQGDVMFGDTLRSVFGAEYEKSSLRTFDAFSGTDRQKTDIGSVYGQMIIQPTGGLTLTAGARHDDHKQFGGKTTFGGNLAWNIGNTTIRSSYAEGFKAPTLSQLYGFGGSTSLRPELAKSIDAGIEQNLIDGRVKISATYFNRRSRNLIVSDPATFQLSNIAKAKAEGAEFALTARPSDTLSISANYSHVVSKNRTIGDVNFGRNLRYRPKDSASVSADWKSGRFGMGATVQIISDSFDNASNTRRIDGRATADIRGSFDVTDSIEFYARAENLFDAQYETVRGYGTLGRAVYAGARAKF